MSACASSGAKHYKAGRRHLEREHFAQAVYELELAEKSMYRSEKVGPALDEARTQYATALLSEEKSLAVHDLPSRRDKLKQAAQVAGPLYANELNRDILNRLDRVESELQTVETTAAQLRSKCDNAPTKALLDAVKLPDLRPFRGYVSKVAPTIACLEAAAGSPAYSEIQELVGAGKLVEARDLQTAAGKWLPGSTTSTVSELESAIDNRRDTLCGQAQKTNSPGIAWLVCPRHPGSDVVDAIASEWSVSFAGVSGSPRNQILKAMRGLGAVPSASTKQRSSCFQTTISISTLKWSAPKPTQRILWSKSRGPDQLVPNPEYARVAANYNAALQQYHASGGTSSEAGFALTALAWQKRLNSTPTHFRQPTLEDYQVPVREWIESGQIEAEVLTRAADSQTQTTRSYRQASEQRLYTVDGLRAEDTGAWYDSVVGIPARYEEHRLRREQRMGAWFDALALTAIQSLVAAHDEHSRIARESGQNIEALEYQCRSLYLQTPEPPRSEELWGSSTYRDIMRLNSIDPRPQRRSIRYARSNTSAPPAPHMSHLPRVRNKLHRAMLSTVVVRSPSTKGSGAILSPNGLVLTNAHVAAEGSIQIDIPGRGSHEARVVKIDHRRDLALLKADVKQLRPIILRRSRPIVGEEVYAVGSQEGLDASVTKGIVSAIRTLQDVLKDDELLALNLSGGTTVVQSDVTIGPGNSGGPLIDKKGRMIGINTLLFQGRIGISIAADELYEFLR